MNDITALMATMKAAAEKATPGEWWSDVVETDGEYGDGEDRHSGYHSYAVYVGSESLLDMTNSTAACIHEEWDHDYHMAWDETAKRNAEFIAVASPANVRALVEALEKAQQENTASAAGMAESYEATISMLKSRIAELESRTVTVKLPQRQEPTSSGHYGEGYLVPSYAGSALDYEDTIEALAAAGIQVIEGEGQ